MIPAPVLVVAALLAPGEAELQWASFRGPNGSGISPSESVPAELNAEENLTFLVPAGPGFSSPVVSEDAVFLTSHDGNKLFTTAYDRFTGETLWVAEAPEENDDPYRGPNSPVSSTPVTDGERVVVLYPSFGLVAYSLEGEELWRKAMDRFNVPHVMSTSPILAGNLVLLQCDQDTDSFLLAVSKETGEEAWKVSRPGVTHGYSSPVLYRPADGDPQVLVSGSFQFCAYSLEKGEKLWWVEGMSWQGVTLPVLSGEGVAFVHSAIPPLSEFGAPKMDGSFEDALKEHDKDGSGKISRDEWAHEQLQQLWFLYDLDNDDLLDSREWNEALARGRAQGGMHAVRLGGKEDVTGSNLLWTLTERRGMPDFASPLLYEGVLYTIKDGGVLTSFDPASGEVLKQARVAESDEYFASPVAANGKIVLAGKSGQLTVVEAGAEWEELSSHRIDQEIWSTPALADGQVFVRTQESLYCFE